MKTAAFVLCRLLFAVEIASMSVSAADEATFKPLFNGSDLSGWEGDMKYFSVQGGAIHAETTAAEPLKKNTFLIYKTEQFGDFELRFDYKVVGGNSGMQYRSEIVSPFVLKGYQADFENQNRYTGTFFEENGRMFLGLPGEFVVVKPLTDATKAKNAKARATLEKIPFAKKEEVFNHISDPTAWHSITIVARGNTFVHIVDGRVMSVAIDDDAKNFRASGYLGLQVHSGPPMTIDLKNIRIRALK